MNSSYFCSLCDASNFNIRLSLMGSARISKMHYLEVNLPPNISLEICSQSMLPWACSVTAEINLAMSSSENWAFSSPSSSSMSNSFSDCSSPKKALCFNATLRFLGAKSSA